MTETQTDNRGKVLNAVVHVTHPETGEGFVFGPPGTVGLGGERIEDEVPEWAQQVITNPNVWVTEDELADAEPIPGPSQSVYFDLEEGGAGDETEGEDQTETSHRPRSRTRAPSKK
jgi:hypothetical protein